MFYPKRVRLTCDLTRYRAGLVEGSLGWTTGQNAQWGVIVKYDNGAELDTLWCSLDVLEEETKAKELETRLWHLRCDIRSVLGMGATPAQLRKLVTEASKPEPGQRRKKRSPVKGVSPRSETPRSSELTACTPTTAVG